MNRFTVLLSFWGCLILCGLISCSGGKNKSLAEKASASGDYESEDVNAIQQALPTIMVLPSDNLLEEYMRVRACLHYDWRDPSCSCNQVQG